MNNRHNYDLMNRALEIFKRTAPVRKGEFRKNIQGELTEEGFIVYIDDTFVPYSEHVLTTRQRNPNAGWDEEAAQLFALILSQLLNATQRTGEGDIDK